MKGRQINHVCHFHELPGGINILKWQGGIDEKGEVEESCLLKEDEEQEEALLYGLLEGYGKITRLVTVFSC